MISLQCHTCQQPSPANSEPTTGGKTLREAADEPSNILPATLDLGSEVVKGVEVEVGQMKEKPRQKDELEAEEGADARIARELAESEELARQLMAEEVIVTHVFHFGRS